MMICAELPKPGEMVFVRQRRYLVESVTPSLKEGEATKLALACVDDDAQGQRLEVLWEHEIHAEVLRVEISVCVRFIRPDHLPAGC